MCFLTLIVEFYLSKMENQPTNAGLGMNINQTLRDNIKQRDLMVENNKKEVRELLESDDPDRFNKALLLSNRVTQEISVNTLDVVSPILAQLDNAAQINQQNSEFHKARIENLEAQNNYSVERKVFQDNLEDEVLRASHRIYIKNSKQNWSKQNALKKAYELIKKLLAYRGQTLVPVVLSADLRFSKGRVSGVSIMFANKHERDLVAKSAADIPAVFNNSNRFSFTDEVPNQYMKANYVFNKLATDLVEVMGGKTKVRMNYQSKRLVLQHALKEDSPMIERFSYTPTFKPKNTQKISEYEEVKPDIMVIEAEEIADFGKAILFKRAYPDDEQADIITSEYVLNTISANISDDLYNLILDNKTTKEGLLFTFRSEKEASCFFNAIKDNVFSWIKIVGSYMGEASASNIDYEKRVNDRREATARKAGELAAMKVREAAKSKEAAKHSKDAAKNSDISPNSSQMNMSLGSNVSRNSSKRKADEEVDTWHMRSNKKHATGDFQMDKNVHFDEYYEDPDPEYFDATASSYGLDCNDFSHDYTSDTSSVMSIASSTMSSNKSNYWNGNYNGSNRAPNRGMNRGMNRGSRGIQRGNLRGVYHNQNRYQNDSAFESSSDRASTPYSFAPTFNVKQETHTNNHRGNNQRGNNHRGQRAHNQGQRYRAKPRRQLNRDNENYPHAANQQTNRSTQNRYTGYNTENYRGVSSSSYNSVGY